MTSLDAILLRRAEEQMRTIHLPPEPRDSWRPAKPQKPPRVSMAGVVCRCGAPAKKKLMCHRCYMRARRMA